MTQSSHEIQIARRIKSRAQIAQLVEQRTENPCVTGSNPVDATKKERSSIRKCRTLFSFRPIASPFREKETAVHRNEPPKEKIESPFRQSLDLSLFLQRRYSCSISWIEKGKSNFRKMFSSLFCGGTENDVMLSVDFCTFAKTR